MFPGASEKRIRSGRIIAVTVSPGAPEIPVGVEPAERGLPAAGGIDLPADEVRIAEKRGDELFARGVVRLLRRVDLADDALSMTARRSAMLSASFRSCVT